MYSILLLMVRSIILTVFCILLNHVLLRVFYNQLPINLPMQLTSKGTDEVEDFDHNFIDSSVKLKQALRTLSIYLPCCLYAMILIFNWR